MNTVKSALIKTVVISILATILFLIQGCQNPFNPPVIKNQQSYQPRANTTPRDVLLNLEAAYNQQNIDLYINCLSREFRFELLASESEELGIDMDGDGIKDSWWNYDKEVEYHQNLFQNGSSDGKIPPPDNVFLNLQIPPENSWQKDMQDGREDWIIIPAYFNLMITVYGGSNISADGNARFYLKPEANEWKIVIWRDESNI